MAAIPKVVGRDAQAARAAAEKVVRTHERLSAWLRAGVTLAEVDAFVARTLEELSCKSCFHKYRVGRKPPFPSHACLSVNDCVVHGTAGYYLPPMKEGDVLKIDIGVWFEGWVGDAAWTYVFGPPGPLVKRLTECGKESLRRGVRELRPGRPWIGWAQAVQGFVEGPDGCGFHLVRGLGGHGYYEKQLHGPPFVSNTVPTHGREWPEALSMIQPGTLVAVEPMIAVGTGTTDEKPDQWPVRVADGSLSVHYEHDVLIGEDGPEVLTAALEAINDVVAV